MDSDTVWGGISIGSFVVDDVDVDVDFAVVCGGISVGSDTSFTFRPISTRYSGRSGISVESSICV